MRASVSSLLLVLGLHPLAPVLAQEPTCPSPDPSLGVGAIVGQVIDAQTQVPLGFVQIRLRVQGVELTLETRSNTLGWFQFCSVPPGKIWVNGSLSQLGGAMGPVSLEAGESLSLSLELSPASDGRNTGSLAGVVVDHESGEPIEGAEVSLPATGQTAISNALGRFTFPSLTPGNLDLEVSRLGYRTATGMVGIEFGRTVHTQVDLSMEAIGMDPITVTAIRRRIELPGLDDFERRFNSGWGQFVLEEEIQRRMPLRLGDVLLDKGVEMRGNGTALFIRRTGCGPTVYIDDVKVTNIPRSGGLAGGLSTTGNPRPPGTKPPGYRQGSPAEEAADAVNNMIHPLDVVAVEVYRGPAETPGQYLDSNARCGVILIWTRRGNISGR